MVSSVDRCTLNENVLDSSEKESKKYMPTKVWRKDKRNMPPLSQLVPTGLEKLGQHEPTGQVLMTSKKWDIKLQQVIYLSICATPIHPCETGC